MQNVKIQYVTDEQGNKQAVMIPIKEWEKLEKQFQELIEYSSLKNGLKEAFLELKEIMKGNKKGKSAKDFLNEL